MTGFVLFFRPKVQGLFKDFPGPYFVISRTFLSMNLPSTKQNICVESYVLGINTCTCRNARQRELENSCKPDIRCALVAQWTCARATREQWEQKNDCFHTFCKHFEKFILCIPEHLFSLAFIYFKNYKRCYFSILFNKKSRTFKNQKPISSTFKAFKSDS